MHFKKNDTIYYSACVVIKEYINEKQATIKRKYNKKVHEAC